MLRFSNQNSRICVLESQFEIFQESTRNHMENEERVFSTIADSMKDIIHHIDDAKKENKESIDGLKTELIGLIDREYVSKTEMNVTLTKMRSSVLDDIEKERKRSAKEFWVLVTSAATVFVLCGWLYVNVLKDDNGPKTDAYSREGLL